MTNSVTVLIPAHNEADFIATAVKSAFRQTVPPQKVLVIADSCTDDTARIAAECGADVIEVGFASKPRSLNHALEQVATSHVALLDADGYFASEQVFETCLRVMDERGYGGVCLSVTPHSSTGLFQRSRAVEWAAAHRVSRIVETWHGWVAVLSGSAGVYRADDLRAVGGWSTDSLCEDVELALKMNRHGRPAGFVRGEFVAVRDPSGWREYWAQTHRWASGWAQAIDKHKGLFFRSWGFTKVFGAMMVDSVLLAMGYASLLYHLATGFTEFDAVRWFGSWFLVMVAITLTTASLQLGVRRALACYPAYLLVGTLGTAFALWVMFREWVLGRHLVSWTGRQRRRTVVTPIPDRRRRALGLLGAGAGWATALTGTLRGDPDLAATGIALAVAVPLAALPWRRIRRTLLLA
ncbi:cellulose synthase/poly-beta-1,6-N-acetylglucosamine synthase-like glycosyltransferase [Streptomyces sp. TLI_235]|nr:cellulose synthase/poly-beta-1,6-N-acetylglucosamine synthase-like glycosyltransferase [Streptomyces sp. TLI_235]